MPEPSAPSATVLVWDLPVRVMHWTLAASVAVAWLTANVFDTVHEIAGYLALALVAFRIVWGFAGTRTARFASFVRPPGAVLRYLWHLVQGRPGRYRGLNPAGAAMAVTLLVLIVVSSISGWMQITQRFFGVAWVEELHSISSYGVLILAAVHIASVLIVSALQKENLPRAMITGRKQARDGDA